MTIGVGGSNAKTELAKLSDMTAGVRPIEKSEYQVRIDKAQSLMKEQGIDAIYLHAGTNLYYFTGTRWNSSERMVGAVLLQDGAPEYIGPAFEEGTIQQFMVIDGDVHVWNEHETPYHLLERIVGTEKAKVGLDEATPFFVSNGLAKSSPGITFENASTITAACRMIKSENELALMQRAKEMTLEVHKAVARIMREGITVPDD